MLLNAGVLIFFRNFKWTWRCKCQAPSTGNCDDRQREDQPQRGWLKQRIIHKIIQLCHGHENDGFFLRDSTPINDRLLVKLTGSQTVFFLGEKQTEITLNWFMEWSGWYLISSGQMKHCRSSDLKVLISFINDSDLPNLQVDVCYACVLITKSVHAFRRAFPGRGLLEGQDYTYRAQIHQLKTQSSIAWLYRPSICYGSLSLIQYEHSLFADELQAQSLHIQENMNKCCLVFV